ncbi:MAG: nucleotidyltransferase family protein [Deltaproteobacteria bacterium]|nr:nucleotidyltransferase family protein [Deltaproteobacteria bacterium]
MAIAGVVLAAGASQRMGTCKALLRYQSETFLDLLSQALHAGGCSPVVAVVSNPTDLIVKECNLVNVEVVINPDPSGGQISSVRSVLPAVGNVEGLLVVLVDQACIEPETVSRVRQGLGQHSVVVARYRNQPGHPSCFSRSLFADLKSPMADKGARAVVESELAAGRVSYLDFDDPGVIRNLNTPEDYQAFLKRPT